jgi:hypothetical protein
VTSRAQDVVIDALASEHGGARVQPPCWHGHGCGVWLALGWFRGRRLACERLASDP